MGSVAGKGSKCGSDNAEEAAADGEGNKKPSAAADVAPLAPAAVVVFEPLRNQPRLVPVTCSTSS